VPEIAEREANRTSVDVWAYFSGRFSGRCPVPMRRSGSVLIPRETVWEEVGCGLVPQLL
jgi:hypothetical protein